MEAGWRMDAELRTKSRRVDNWLAFLNFGLAGVHALPLPFCAFGWYFAWSMSDPLESWVPPKDLIAILGLGGTVLLGGTLCLGFSAGMNLLKGKQSGRTLTLLLVILTGLHLSLVTFALLLHETLSVMDGRLCSSQRLDGI